MRKNYTRRSFLSFSAFSLSAVVRGGSPVPARKRSRLGLYTNLGSDPETDIRQFRELGSDYCEIYNDNFTATIAEQLIQALKKHHVMATALFAMGPGDMILASLIVPAELRWVSELAHG